MYESRTVANKKNDSLAIGHHHLSGFAAIRTLISAHATCEEYFEYIIADFLLANLRGLYIRLFALHSVHKLITGYEEQSIKVKNRLKYVGEICLSSCGVNFYHKCEFTSPEFEAPWIKVEVSRIECCRRSVQLHVRGERTRQFIVEARCTNAYRVVERLVSRSLQLRAESG